MPRTHPGRIYLTRAAEAIPRDSTRAEAFYYQKQIEASARLVVALIGGGRLEGRLVSHDADTLGFVLTDGRDLLLAKRELRYLHKAREPRAPARRVRPRS